MAAITKPSVFEVKVTDENKDDIMRCINEIRLTKSFFDECAEVSRQFSRKDDIEDDR